VKKIIASLLAFTMVSIPMTVHAVENGVSAEGDPRIVSLYKGYGSPGYISIDFPMCSAYLISDRIVATAQHCTMNPQINGPRDASELFVGYPGEKSNATNGRHIAVSAVYRAKDYKRYDLQTDLSYTNDVAVLVLSKPVPNVTKAKLLSQEELAAFSSTNPEIWIGGYGYQNVSEREIPPNKRFVIPAKAPAKFADIGEYKAAISFWKSRWKRTNYQESLVGLTMPIATGTICDGDSGSGFWSTSGSKTIYLGVMNGTLGLTNCLGESPYAPISFIGFHPTHQYQSLFTAAEKYVKANPVKTTITCKKGKLTKKVKAVNPKCPAGYKKS
jgi:hypothetical protein